MSLIRVLTSIATAALIMGGNAAAQPTASPPASSPSAKSPINKQSWELRRERYAQITKALQNKDDLDARSEFTRIIRGFESRPFQLTPLESMDLLGSVFVPQFGLEKMLPLVVAQAALGLYDAQRFASPGGLADLLQGENFLERALILAGPQEAAKSRNFLIDKPALAASLIAQGLNIAETEKDFPAYDIKWVTALGRGLDICPAGAKCPVNDPAKAEDWPRIWSEVREMISKHYKITTEPKSPNPSGKP